jgi:hypothetical protein
MGDGFSELHCSTHTKKNATGETKDLKLRNVGLLKPSKLYRPSERRLSAKLVPTFADRGCRVVSATDPYGR